MSNSRKIATLMLQEIIENQLFFSEVKSNVEGLESKDIAFVNMLVLTTLRHIVYIRKALSPYVKKSLPDNVIFGEYAIILATAEILYLHTPDYAVLNSYVELIKKNTNKFVAGFANAVLRKICANREAIEAEDKGEFFPSDFLRILNQDYNKNIVAEIQHACLNEPALDLTVKNNHQEWANKLNGTLLGNGTIRLKNEGKITDIEGYSEGEWWVQDVAASLAVQALGKIEGLKVLDLCAAPGGKTAQLINAGAKVCSLDISDSRLDTLKQNMVRLRIKSPEIVCADAVDFLKDFNQEKYDIILLDAPCSATGTIRRHPELVHIKRLGDVDKQSNLQKELLSHVEKALKKDGILLYCTCSIAKTEGEKQINKFLANNSNFKLIPIKENEINIFPENKLESIISEEGFIRTMPYYLEECGGMDSFFIAKLQKVN